jgi:hypothetical protein
LKFLCSRCITSELSAWGLNTNYVGPTCESKRTTFGQNLFILIVVLASALIFSLIALFLIVTHKLRRKHRVNIVAGQQQARTQIEPMYAYLN